MRVAIPFLISSLVLVSLTLDVSQMINDHFLWSSTTTQNLVSLNSKPQRNQPKGSNSNRGSGRRDSIKSQFYSYMNV